MGYSLCYICSRILVVTIIMEVIFMFIHLTILEGRDKRKPSRTVRNRPRHTKLIPYILPSNDSTFNRPIHEHDEVYEESSRSLMLDSGSTYKRTKLYDPLVLHNKHVDSFVRGNASVESEPSSKESGERWTCRQISKIEIIDDLGRGTTKQAFLGQYNGTDVCVKMVTSSVTDVRTCLRKQSLSAGQCFLLANYKLMKEIGLILQLKHHSIIKMIGYCIRSEANTKNTKDHGVVMATEIGVKVTPYRIQKMPWSQRLQAVVDLASLFHYMHASPLGSLRIGDFKQSQFVFVNGRIKLSDLDDVTNEERVCRKDRDCHILAEPARVSCLNGVCSGINAKANLLLGAVELIQPLLTGAPSPVRNVTERLLDDLNYKRLSSAQFKDDIERIVEIWLSSNS